MSDAKESTDVSKAPSSKALPILNDNALAIVSKVNSSEPTPSALAGVPGEANEPQQGGTSLSPSKWSFFMRHPLLDDQLTQDENAKKGGVSRSLGTVFRAPISMSPANMSSYIRLLAEQVECFEKMGNLALMEKELSKRERFQAIVDFLFSASFPDECIEELSSHFIVCMRYPKVNQLATEMFIAELGKMSTAVLQELTTFCSALKSAIKDNSIVGPVSSMTIRDKYSNESIIIHSEAGRQVKLSTKLPQMSLQNLFLRNLKMVIQIRSYYDDSEQLKKFKENSLSSFHLEYIWSKLTECFELLRGMPDKKAILILQPLVEIFFLMCAPPKISQTQSSESELAHINRIPTTIPPIPTDPTTTTAASTVPTTVSIDRGKGSLPVFESAETFSMAAKDPENKFLHFIATNRMALNEILREKKGLFKQPFDVMINFPQVLDFDIKRNYLKSQLVEVNTEATVNLLVHRKTVFEDTFRLLEGKTVAEWKTSFHVIFVGEPGEDAGGLLREWQSLVSQEIFNPNYALFATAGDQATYTINRSSHCNLNHLNYFKFVGRFLAKVLYDQQHLSSYFTRSLYKHILGKTLHYTDMQKEDKDLYNGLVYLLGHSMSEMSSQGTETFFVIDDEEFGVHRTVDLIPNGHTTLVTDANKHEYVQCVCNYKMLGSIRPQLAAFLEGFYSLLPKRLISIFSEHELELLLAGLPVVDIDDLKANALYDGYQEDSQQILWLWQALYSFDQTERAKFLQFSTGTSKTPLGGFTALGNWHFTIRRAVDHSSNHLPTAHTCSNQLELPAYETYEKLRHMLLKTINEGLCFGFV